MHKLDSIYTWLYGMMVSTLAFNCGDFFDRISFDAIFSIKFNEIIANLLWKKVECLVFHTKNEILYRTCCVLVCVVFHGDKTETETIVMTTFS